MEEIKSMTSEELMSINGGGWLQDAAFVAGYILGGALDAAHGLYDGLTGHEKH